MRRLDEALEDIGDYGLYQRRLYLILILTATFPVLEKWAWYFIAPVPEHRCTLPFEDPRNWTSLDLGAQNQLLLYGGDADRNAGTYGNENDTSCTFIYRTEAVRNNMNGKNMSEAIQPIRCIRWDFDDSVYKSSVVTEFDLVCERKWLHEFGNKLYVAGEIGGFIIWGTLADRFGRKMIFFVCLTFHALSGLLAGMVTSLSGILAMRASLGLFSPGFFIGAILRIEFVGPSMRMIAAIIDRAAQTTGLFILTLLAFLFRDWRKLQIIVSIPSFMYLSAWWFVPESARWLLAQGQERDGRKIVSKMATRNKREVTMDSYETDEPDKSEFIQMNPINLCCFSNTRLRLLIVSFIWLTNSLSLYYLIGHLPLISENHFTHFTIVGVVEYAAYILCLFTLNRFGKRIPLCIAMVVAGILVCSLIFIPPDSPNLTISLCLVGKISLVVGFCAAYVLGIELQPTVVRGGATGIYAASAAVGQLLAPYLILTKDVWHGFPHALCGIIAALGGLSALLLPETTGRQMPEILQDTENLSESDEISNRSASNQRESPMSFPTQIDEEAELQVFQGDTLLPGHDRFEYDTPEDIGEDAYATQDKMNQFPFQFPPRDPLFKDPRQKGPPSIILEEMLPRRNSNHIVRFPKVSKTVHIDPGPSGIS